MNYDKNLFHDFEASVIELANKLPQWNRDSQYDRRQSSALLSLYEEAGEIAGALSKKAYRKHYYNVNPKTLEDFNEIRQKFIDETGDLFWVIVCSNYSLEINFNIELMLDKFFNIYDLYDKELDKCDIYHCYMALKINLYNFFNSVFMCFCNDENVDIFPTYITAEDFQFVIEKFVAVIIVLSKIYNITLDDIMINNIEKLGKRYDKDGKRVDGK